MPAKAAFIVIPHTLKLPARPRPILINHAPIIRIQKLTPTPDIRQHPLSDDAPVAIDGHIH